MKREGVRRSALRPLLWLLALLILLDRAIFGYGLWQLPDESAWAGQAHYHFEHRLRHLQAGSRADPLVLIVGSSVALYGYLPAQIETALNRVLAAQNVRAVRVRMLAHQGMTPMHLLAYQRRVQALHPLVIVYAINPIDLRLEKPLVHQDAQRIQVGHPERSAALMRYSRSIASGSELMALAPRRTLQLYGSALSGDTRLALANAVLWQSWRYRNLLQPALAEQLDNHWASGRHYHYYAGRFVTGVSRTGWLAPEFRIRINQVLVEQGVRVQVPAELFRDQAGAVMQYRYCPAGSEPCRQGELDLRPGWQILALGKPLKVGDEIYGRVEPAWYDPISADQRSLRLPRNFGLAAPARRGDQEHRPLRFEDQQYIRMSPAEYRQAFERRVLAFDRRGMEYLQAIRDARIYWSGRSFDPEIPTWRAFREWRRQELATSRSLIVINTAENPLSQAWFGTSRWYKTWLAELTDVDPTQADRYAFFDWHAALDMRYFYDYNHPVYAGAQALSERLVQPLARAVIAAESGLH
ncbi:MAG: hypothetical protein KDK39_05885 [Leptospiraceae bacterium]|nr:hypothetical protein [Leptospiraceae bacterium]